VQIDSALNRQYEGTGLGLALVKRLVELHGGQVAVSSKVGIGSRFSVELPCSWRCPINPGAEANTASQGHSEFRPRSETTGALILLAEDNEANIRTVSSYLKAKGYKVVVANDGQAAVATAQAERPDLILMDVQMPEMDGLTAIAQIRQDPSLVNVPIIAMTALAMEADRDRCLAAGANAYLSKPAKLKQVVTTIQDLLASQSE
jgi:CheY-like chemotaxis protein